MTSPFDHPPTMISTGEITYADGYRVLVPQPVKFESIPSRRCMSCLRVGPHAPDCLDDRTVILPVVQAEARVRGYLADNALTVTGVIRAIVKDPETHAEDRTGIPRVPVWSLAAIVSGLVLMAIGWVLNDPVAQFVFEAIPR